MNIQFNSHFQIYTMTLRLSNLFEEQMKKIFKRSSSRLKRSARSNRGRNERRRNGASTSHAHTNGGPSTSRQYTRVRHHSSDEEEEVDVINGETPSTSTGRPTRQSRVRQNQSARRTGNDVSSSHNEPGPSGFQNKRTRRLQSDNEMSEVSTDSSESESSNESENYDPNEPKSNRKAKALKKKEKRTNGNSAKRPRRLVLHESSDEEQIEESPMAPVSSQNGKRARGRPRKSQISDDESDHEENESEADEEEDDEEEEEEEGQSNNQSEEQSEEEVEQNNYRPKRTAARQSPVRSTRQSNRRNLSDDSDTPLRPRRNALKRVQEDDSYDENEITTSSTRHTITANTQEQRTRRRRQLNTTPDHEEDGPEESSRPIRSTRNTLNSSRDNGTANQDSEDDSDDDQLLSQIASQSRPKRSPRAVGTQSAPISTEFVDTTSPIHLNGTSLPRTREMIRRKQSTVSTSSTSTVAPASSQSGYHSVTRSMTTTETTTQIEIRRNQVNFCDYNQIKALNKHFDNFFFEFCYILLKKLFLFSSSKMCSIQIQEDHNYGEPGPSTLRYSRRTQLSRLQRSTEELDRSVVSNTTDSPVDPLRIPENIAGRLRNRMPRSNVHVDNENDSDPDDDKPLHLMVTESPTRGRPSRHTARYSDEHVSNSPAGSSSVPTSSTRSGRNQKRPYYNEESDDEDSHRAKRQTTQGRYVQHDLR